MKSTSSQHNGTLLEAIQDIQIILRASIASPTHCKDLVAGWQDYIGIFDTLSHGVGGVVVRELSALPPTVFQFKWPQDISKDLISFQNPTGKINNSDLEMVGLLFLWLCVEAIAPDIAHKYIALFSNNSSTMSWVEKMASWKSRIAAQLVCALTLCLNINKTYLLTPMLILGVENALTDIPSCLFGSVKEWECKTDNKLLSLFNQKFPLPNQASWTVFHFNTAMTMHMTSTLGITLAEWQQLYKIRKHNGEIRPNMSYLWDWTLSYRGAVHKKSACPHRVCGTSPQGDLWAWKASPG
jgi:hypothetical protein